MRVELKNIEQGTWTTEWSTSINPVKSDGFAILPTEIGLRIVNVGKKYSAQLAKNVIQFPYTTTELVFRYSFAIDDLTKLYGQVIETDPKYTNNDGFTFDCSFQWNIAKGWIAQVGDPWVDTKIVIPPPGVNKRVDIAIAFALDHVKYTSQVVKFETANMALSSDMIDAPRIAASQLGWERNTIVTQLQLCQNGEFGAYSVLFDNISYSAEVL